MNFEKVSLIPAISSKECFDILTNIVSSKNENIRIYQNNNVITIDGLVYKEGNTRNLFHISHLVDPQWDLIPMGTAISIKNFSIDTGNQHNCMVAQYMLDHFGPKTINDCLLVKCIKNELSGNDSYVTTGFLGCSFVMPIKYSFVGDI